MLNQFPPIDESGQNVFSSHTNVSHIACNVKLRVKRHKENRNFAMID